MDSTEDELTKALRVEAGEPNDEELAAVIAVLIQARKQQRRVQLEPHSKWARNSSLLRQPLQPGNGQWRSSYSQGL